MVDLNQSARKKIKFGQEELAKLQEARIVRGNLGKFESVTGSLKGRNAKWRKEIAGRKDSGRKRQEVQNKSFPQINTTQGELNISETQRVFHFRNFNFIETEGSQNEVNLKLKDAHFPKLRLCEEKLRPSIPIFDKTDEIKPEISEKVASEVKSARTEKERQKGREKAILM